MHKSFPLLCSLMMLLAGCTTTSSPKGKPQFAPTNLREATIYVFDDVPGVLGHGTVVVANGTPIGSLSRGKYTWFFTRAGVLDLSMHDRLHGGRTLASQRFAVRAGRSYYIRYRMVRYEQIEIMADGLSKDSRAVVSPVLAGDLVEIPESEGIALAGTHRLVDIYAPATLVHHSSRRNTPAYK
jgi:hypothetical protein